jgi:hypothetical protein
MSSQMNDVDIVMQDIRDSLTELKNQKNRQKIQENLLAISLT